MKSFGGAPLMYVNPFQISLETLVGAAPMLGHALEDRTNVRDAQDLGLLHKVQAESATKLRDPSQRGLFCVAPLDLLVTECDGKKQYHLIEINGTGIGGLTNLTGNAVSAVLGGLQEMAEGMPQPDAVVLIASSGKEADDAPRLNKLLHEKVLYAEALKRGFDYTGRPARVVTADALAADPAAMPQTGPVIVLGYIKDLLAQLQLDAAGRLSLHGRQVYAALNDRFCLNVLHRFGLRVDLRDWRTMNRTFVAGADKGVAYGLLNDFVARHDAAFAPVPHVRVGSREELIATVEAWVKAGRRPVIKPQGTGLGHGIEFFLDGDESTIAERIDRSLRQTEALYGIPGGALPYTVCDFLDTCAIDRPGHRFHGHKYELRVVVYRDGHHLQAFPSIAKVASAAYDAAHPDRLSLINNITASAEAHHAAGSDFMLPLCRPDTLALLSIPQADLTHICASATRFVRDLLDRVQDTPAALGLPRTPFHPLPATAASLTAAARVR